ncbi:hypothetical protein ANCDUO_17496 [Ancylostoma duodenale]|uniref:Uncharacterized protein n=1 Tax=Ancylostoma duodenale TaxID=51022 RepID=A0A0C2C7Y8_9BILA|nr:hypothetical protein ANCDUO_17496 [Ancylostoma duodenale]
MRLHEFFQINIDESVKKFEELAKAGASSEVLDENLPMQQDPEWRRFGCTVDFDKALKIFNRPRGDASSEEDRVAKCTDTFRGHLNYLNEEGICHTRLNPMYNPIAVILMAYNIKDRIPKKAIRMVHKRFISLIVTCTTW